MWMAFAIWSMLADLWRPLQRFKMHKINTGPPKVCKKPSRRANGWMILNVSGARKSISFRPALNLARPCAEAIVLASASKAADTSALKWILAIFVLSLIACGRQEVTPDINKAVSVLHDSYNARRFGEIYEKSASSYRRNVPAKAHQEFFQKQFERRGPVQSTSRMVRRDARPGEARLVAARYCTVFLRESATEFFVFGIREGGRSLALVTYKEEPGC